MGVTTREKSKTYISLLGCRETFLATKILETEFSTKLAESLNLIWVPAPQAVESGRGINDDLNGIEKPVAFTPVQGTGIELEIVQSLAKWKRTMLAELTMIPGEGIYADLNAIRPDEFLGPMHSFFVDQWEWEQCIAKGDRTLSFLKRIVCTIFSCLRSTEDLLADRFPVLGRILPERITFIGSEDLLQRYPGSSPQERENFAAREHGAVFVIGVGAELSDGRPHDGRAPDYDDWSTPTELGYGLNGDLLVWHPVLERALELSSMGIRVNRRALLRQLDLRGIRQWCHREFHRRLLEGRLPLSVGGGIGKSRVGMFLLRKAHIGEVQSGVWPLEARNQCRDAGIQLL